MAEDNYHLLSLNQTILENLKSFYKPRERTGKEMRSFHLEKGRCLSGTMSRKILAFHHGGLAV